VRCEVRTIQGTGYSGPNDRIGNGYSADLTALLQSAAFELWRYCAPTQLSGIEVYHRADHPQTDLKRTPDRRIAIGLTAQDTDWAQYSLQFSIDRCPWQRTAPISASQRFHIVNAVVAIT
jgi:hypothetical protein